MQGGSPVSAAALFCWATLLFIQAEEPATRHVCAKKKKRLSMQGGSLPGLLHYHTVLFCSGATVVHEPFTALASEASTYKQ